MPRLSTDPRFRGAAAPEPLEELEELQDDAIVAQQGVTLPQKARDDVVVDEASVVVADLPAEVDPSELLATRQLAAYPMSRDPTVVIRRAPIPPVKKSAGWVVLVIWLFAGLLAFAFGGLLALLSARGDTTPAAPATSPAQPGP